MCDQPDEKLRDQMADGQELDERTGVILPMDAQVIVSLFCDNLVLNISFFSLCLATGEGISWSARPASSISRTQLAE